MVRQLLDTKKVVTHLPQVTSRYQRRGLLNWLAVLKPCVQKCAVLTPCVRECAVLTPCVQKCAVLTPICTKMCCVLRWVKATSKCIVHDTEVCEGIAIIRGRFITIYGG